MRIDFMWWMLFGFSILSNYQLLSIPNLLLLLFFGDFQSSIIMNRLIKSFHLNHHKQIIRLLNQHYYPSTTMLQRFSSITVIDNGKFPCQLINRYKSLNTNISQIRGMKLWNEKLLRKMYWRKRSFDAQKERLRARSEWQDWDYASELYAFAHRLQEPELSNNNILVRAFTHRSYVSEQRAKQESLGVQDVQEYLEDNSELIDLGRQFMEKFLSQYIRYHLQQAPEECIQSLVQYLMSTSVLDDISKWIGCIGKFNE